MTNHPPHRNDHDTNHNYHSITPTAHSTAPTSAPAAQRVNASKVNIHSIIWLWLYLEPPWRKTAIHAWLLQKSFGWLLSGRSGGLGVFIFLEYWDFCIKYNGQVWHSWRSAGDAARSSGRQCVGQHWYAPPTPRAPGPCAAERYCTTRGVLARWHVPGVYTCLGGGGMGAIFELITLDHAKNE